MQQCYTQKGKIKGQKKYVPCIIIVIVIIKNNIARETPSCKLQGSKKKIFEAEHFLIFSFSDSTFMFLANIFQTLILHFWLLYFAFEPCTSIPPPTLQFSLLHVTNKKWHNQKEMKHLQTFQGNPLSRKQKASNTTMCHTSTRNISISKSNEGEEWDITLNVLLLLILFLLEVTCTHKYRNEIDEIN